MCGSPKPLVCTRWSRASLGLVWRQKHSPAPRFPCAACPSAWRGIAGCCGPGHLPPPGTSLPVAEPPGLQKVTAELLSEAVCNQLLEMPSERGEWQLL